MSRMSRFASVLSFRSSNARPESGTPRSRVAGKAARPCFEPLEGRTMMSASLPSALPLPLPGPIIPPPPLLLGKISGVKFNDLNANGVRDVGEPGLANWRIYIDKNLNGVFDAGERSALTNVFGQYSINNLAPGTYRVR